VTMRVDLLDPSGERLAVWQTSVGPRQSAVLDTADLLGSDDLPEGFGAVKLVTDAGRVGSLRPYFQFITPGGITSTHEKSGPTRERRVEKPRTYHWIFPVGIAERPSDAWFFCTNAKTIPISGHELIWRSESGEEETTVLPALELDQTACVPLHDYFPAVRDQREPGAVRLAPSTHVAGFILRHDRDRDLWRVQHL
jgi:hypothetical protein